MSLSDDERMLIVGMQLEKSDRFIAEADAIAGIGLWDVVANRIYYSVFHDGRLYAKLQELREKSDYNLVYQSNEEEMKPLLEKAKGLIAKIKAYIA